jgi:hypothetical protein
MPYRAALLSPYGMWVTMNGAERKMDGRQLTPERRLCGCLLRFTVCLCAGECNATAGCRERCSGHAVVRREQLDCVFRVMRDATSM